MRSWSPCFACICEEGRYEHNTAGYLPLRSGRGWRCYLVVWVECTAPTPIDHPVPRERGRTAVSRRAGAVRRHRLLQHCTIDGFATRGNVGCLLSIFTY